MPTESYNTGVGEVLSGPGTHQNNKRGSFGILILQDTQGMYLIKPFMVN